MWKSGNNLVEISDCMQKEINSIMEWRRKWRININANKTEYCIFSKLKQHHGHTIFIKVISLAFDFKKKNLKRDIFINFKVF